MRETPVPPDPHNFSDRNFRASATDLAYSNCQSFFRSGKPYNPPAPFKGGTLNCGKVPFEKGD
jgi:hypothetical protein